MRNTIQGVRINLPTPEELSPASVLELRSVDSLTASAVLDFPLGLPKQMDLTSAVPADTYGIVSIAKSSSESLALEMLRSLEVGGRIQFVIPQEFK
jgi:hypothetical protein